MSGICPELDARLSAELDRYYFSTDGSGLNLDRREKHRVINALHRLWNIEEIACYGVRFATEDIRKVILDLMKPAHIMLALKTVDFNSGAAYSLWLGCAIFMFAKFDEDLQHEIRKGILSRGYLPLVVAGFLSEVVITEKGRHISQRIKVNLSLKEKTQYDFARIVTHGTARKSYAEGNYFMVPNSVLYMDLSGGEILLYQNSPRKPEVTVTSGAFKFVLPNQSISLKTTTNIVKEPPVFTEREQIVLSVLSDHAPHPRTEIEKALGVSTSTTRRILQKMMEDGKITASGTRKNSLYTIDE